jgi:FkbM family methyltransferase
VGRAALFAGKVIDRLMSLTETASPRLAFRIRRHFLRPDMAFLLQLLRRNGPAPETVIDVGAYVGDWAAECRRVFPDARILMIEPWEPRVARLRALCAADPRLEVASALLSSRAGVADFVEQASNSSILRGGAGGAVKMPMTTLDDLVAGTKFESPQLLKIDVQGHDLEVLKGATRTLSSVDVLIVEVSLIPLHPEAPSVRAVIDWLDDRGFQLLDIAGLIRRPVDDALWQMDAVFKRRNSPQGRPDRGW